MSVNVIGKSIGGFNNLGNVLYDFNPKEVVKEYAKNSALKLLEKIKNELKPSGKIREKGLWPQYCQSVIDAAYFLDRFSCVEDFYKWADFFVNDYRAKAALPLMISLEIAGIGFPLACDFLKELGYTEFGKPDVHLKGIFKNLGLLTETNATKEDYETIKIIDRIATKNNITAYAVDKIFWLIGSGNFYKTNKKIGKQKENFLNWLKETKQINIC
jgi:thermostable 8-oxoguanine DNA glycosylase